MGKRPDTKQPEEEKPEADEGSEEDLKDLENGDDDDTPRD